MSDQVQFAQVPTDLTWQWSGRFPVPSPGDRVLIILNGWKIGGKETERGDIPGKVVGYKIIEGWLHIVVDCDFVPHWYMQLGRGRIATFAGRELEPL